MDMEIAFLTQENSLMLYVLCIDSDFSGIFLYIYTHISIC